LPPAPDRAQREDRRPIGAEDTQNRGIESGEVLAEHRLDRLPDQVSSPKLGEQLGDDSRAERAQPHNRVVELRLIEQLGCCGRRNRDIGPPSSVIPSTGPAAVATRGGPNTSVHGG
jgi:hypothetical protein